MRSRRNDLGREAPKGGGREGEASLAGRRCFRQSAGEEGKPLKMCWILLSRKLVEADESMQTVAPSLKFKGTLKGDAFFSYPLFN